MLFRTTSRFYSCSVNVSFAYSRSWQGCWKRSKSYRTSFRASYSSSRKVAYYYEH
jgi:hypothetical protein